jgi:hypothetical protein
VIVVSYGGGTNSTAMLVGLHERDERPDAILFADTGGEKPHTYDHLLTMQEWCVKIGFPQIHTVQSEDRYGNNYTLEQRCLENKMLPSIAYGLKACSEKHKKRPQTKWLKRNGMENATRLLGFDAGEPHRAKDYPNERYPLIEWNWGREECVEAIARAGLPQPGKSACFFCPSSKKHEILELKRTYPELAARAVAMENNAAANLTEVKGLGRSFAWRDLLAFDAAQIKLLPDSPIEIACDCYEGSEP